MYLKAFICLLAASQLVLPVGATTVPSLQGTHNLIVRGNKGPLPALPGSPYVLLSTITTD